MSQNDANFKRITIISLVISALTLSVTIFLFYFLTSAESRSNTFVFTLIYTCVLELIFYGYVVLFLFGGKSNKPLLGATYSSIGATIIVFIVISTFWLLIYNIFLFTLLTDKIYYSTSIVLFSILIILIASLTKLDILQKSDSDHIIKEENEFKPILIEVAELTMRYNNLLKSKNIKSNLESNFESNLQKLQNKIKFLPKSVVNNKNIIDKLINLNTNLGILLSDCEKSSESDFEEKLNKIESAINEHLLFITIINNKMIK